jgi:hypothetical protein
METMTNGAKYTTLNGHGMLNCVNIKEIGVRVASNKYRKLYYELARCDSA